MSIKKKISQVVQDDWQQRSLQSSQPIQPPTYLNPQQELRRLQEAMLHDDKRVATPAYLTASIINTLKFIAKQKGTSVASLIRQIIVEYIKKYEI